MERWESSHHGSWHLFGHSHNMFHPDGLRFDVGVDTNNFHLLSYDEVAAKMSQRLFKAQTDGRNYVGDEKD
jgi:calcineurin-like phosphoesterase family protein